MSEPKFKGTESDVLQDALELVEDAAAKLKWRLRSKLGDCSRLGLCRQIVDALKHVDFKDTTYEGREAPYQIAYAILERHRVGQPSDETHPAGYSEDHSRRTFETYLRDEIWENKIDFSLRASICGQGPTQYVTFYIHATGKDSTTTDFIVRGNGLSTKVDTKVPEVTSDETRKDEKNGR